MAAQALLTPTNPLAHSILSKPQSFKVSPGSPVLHTETFPDTINLNELLCYINLWRRLDGSTG